MMSKIARSNTLLKSTIDKTLKGIMSTVTQLEDNSLERPVMKTKTFTILLKELETHGNIETKLAERIFAICIEEIIEDIKNLANVASIITVLLNKIMIVQCPYPSNMKASAMSMLKALIMLKSNSAKTETLRSVCYETLNSYPDEIVVQLAMDEFQLITDFIFAACLPKALSHYDLPYVFSILQRILKTLPPDKKTEFVKNGISVWFSLLPATLQYISKCTDNNNTLPTEVFESLTDDLVNFDYTDNVKWNNILQCISQPNKYPACLKALLEKGNQNWHRLWMIFVRLLKTQIIKVSGPGGSPINSMLPVVENAFKLDIINRCRAFECWKVLIDNFSAATNDLVFNKKVKLLIIPLRSNNAKVERAALAKFDTWWHFIMKFNLVLDKYADVILIPFLQFCFGKALTNNDESATDKISSHPPGQLSNVLKQMSIQALVEMIGHVKCDSCTDIPKLSNKILNTQLLVKNWDDWMYSFKTAFNFLSTNYEGKSKQWLSCLWQSFLSTLGELPENNVRKDLLDDTLQIWFPLIQDEGSICDSPRIILDVLIPSLILPETNKLNELLLTKGQNNVVMVHQIVMEILKASHQLLRGCDSTTLIKTLKPMVDPIISEGCKSFDHIIDLLKTNSVEPLFIWTVLAETMFVSYNKINQENWHTFLKWPLSNCRQSTSSNTPCAASVWFKLYDIPNQNTTPTFDTELLELLQNDDELNVHLKMTVAVALLKCILKNKSNVECQTVLVLLNDSLNKIDDYEQVEYIVPTLMDSLALLLNKLIEKINLLVANNTMLILNKFLKLVNHKFQNNTEMGNMDIFLQNIFKLMDTVFKIKDYQIYISTVANEIADCYKTFESKPETKADIGNLLKLFLHLDDASTLSKIKSTLNSTKSPAGKKDKTIDKGFSTPDIKKPVKAKKDKEPNITKTVVVDGEEYVVLQSKWKFNPKNLTEKQKEKLIRKREDIPALYQDLSQSQDEFKLSKWKTDSQDSSSASSKSTSKTVTGETMTVLNNIPHTDIVPNIMENLMSENPTKESTQDNNINKNVSTPNSAKKPRMALKDRVFRNVRNLLENSSLNRVPSPGSGKEETVTTIQDIKTSSENNSPRTPNNRLQTIMNAVHAASASKVILEKQSIENVDNQKTPTSKPNNEDLLKSAPANICADRPSRAKRTPKKFENVQMIELKRRKRHNSLNESQSESPSQSDCDVVSDSKTLNSSDNFTNNNNDNKLDTTVVINENVQVDSENIDNKEKLDGDNHNSNKAGDEYPDKIEKASNIPVDTKVDVEPKNGTEAKIYSENKIDNDTKIRGDSTENSVTLEQACLKESIIVEDQSKTATDINIPNLSSCTDDKANMCLSDNQNLQTSIEDEPSAQCNSGKLCDKDEKNTSNNLNCSIAEVTNDSQSKETSPLSTPKNKTNLRNSQGTSNKKRKLKTPLIIRQLAPDRSTYKKNRIEKELAIDTVEGHPLLLKSTSKRSRRKILDLPDKKKPEKRPSTPKSLKKPKTKKGVKDINDSQKEDSVVINESQEKGSQELCSEDVIESSQDSSITTISVASTKVLKKVPVVALERRSFSQDDIMPTNVTQSLLDNFDDTALRKNTKVSDVKDDTVLPENKTASEQQDCNEITANLDTEPMDHNGSDDVILIADEPATPIVVNTEMTCIDVDTEDIANADAQTMDPSIFSETPKLEEDKNHATRSLNTQDHVSTMETEAMIIDITDENSDSSPQKDDLQRKQDFLNNTLEISPIKMQSPLRDQKTPSPDTSKDFVVIELTSPVNSNGEPFEKSNSLEVFSEDKGSPDETDLSPPREESVINSSSPSSSLSLKKNRPQVWSNNRAAQMLGLCVSNKADSVCNTNIDRSSESSEETKRITPVSTPVRKNLKMLYNNEPDSETAETNEACANFLKLKRILPAVDSSPVGPILKRKLVDIADEATISPANKRKRVSFHDPPVSTTVSVHKYIEPGVTRSPQNSLVKRKERERQKEKGKSPMMKSPKRLDSVFKLDTALTKAVESFSESDTTITNSNDTQMSSIEQTPVVQIVRISDLDDKEPICLGLVDCKDPISKIAVKLSSPAMHSLLIKEFEGKIETIGDLAKLTELEVNRLCIKAPKVSITKKVLNDYLSKLNAQMEEKNAETQLQDVIVTPQIVTLDIDVQTDSIALNSSLSQTDAEISYDVGAQTNSVTLTTVGVQTADSGSKSTADIIETCVSERPDFVESLRDILDETSKQKIAEKLSFHSTLQLLSKHTSVDNSKEIIDKVLNCNDVSSSSSATRMLFLQDYLLEKFESKDLILLCSQLLRKVYDKST